MTSPSPDSPQSFSSRRRILTKSWEEYRMAIMDAVETALDLAAPTRRDFPKRIPVVVDLQATTSTGITYSSCQYCRRSLDDMHTADQRSKENKNVAEEHPFVRAQYEVQLKYGLRLIDEAKRPHDEFAFFFLVANDE
jgi:hypothetical protein